MDDRLAKLLLEDNIVTRLKNAEGDIDLLQKLATIKSVDLQTLPIPGTTNPPQAVDPGGWDKSVQYNDGGLFGGDANFTWDKTLQVLTMIGSGAPNIQGTETSGLLISGGDAITTNAAGGAAGVIGGNGDGAGAGGEAGAQGGSGGITGNGGQASLIAGVGGATSGNGGKATLGAGSAFTGNGGEVDIYSGTSITSGNGGEINIQSGTGAGATGNGGDITLTPGDGAGAGVDGIVGINNSDLHILGTGATGLVLYDATLAAYYRITLDNGVLIITAV